MVGERNARASGSRDDTPFHKAAAAVTARICADEVTCDQLLLSLHACGRLSLDDRDVRPLPIVMETLARFAALVERIIGVALQNVIEEDETHLEEIRRFFLRPKETYSIEELANLWRVRPDDVRDIYHDEISKEGASDNPRISWADAVAAGVNFNILRPFAVERALGAEFADARTEAWRTVPILVHLPQFIVDDLADQPSIPAKLSVDVRLEQIILEVFATGEHAIATRTADATARVTG